MSITMRIYQQYDASHEKEFLELEKKFAQLEATRPDYPKGKRMRPVSGSEPCNTLVWQCEFPDMASAHGILDFFHGDSAHEDLLSEQIQYFKQVRIEFCENLDY
ncbi:MAG: hypothetical protein PHT33_10555 [bacterium]|nr:hypothetical protein [bacterium]